MGQPRQIKKLDELMDGALTERFNYEMERVLANVFDPNTSPFVLRFNEDAEAALFEGDGGAWQLRAVENIKNWLTAQLIGCNVEVIA